MIISSRQEQIAPEGEQIRPVPAAPPALGPGRYRALRRFLIRTMLSALWWDGVMSLPGLRRYRRPPMERWRRTAREYRALAAEMGGIMVKLAQFMSTRVDILPFEITLELAALQDQARAAPTEQIAAQIERDFARPLGDLFAWLSPQPIGAASLAQVHRARLRAGQPVAVKVLRPGIRDTVAADLRFLWRALRPLCYLPGASRRMDVALLFQEFSAVTLRELDIGAEGRSIEQFARDFARDPLVGAPRVFWSHTGANTLTMEDVSYIPLHDQAALDAVGIDRAAVARTIYRLYLEQFFVTHTVHADPHAGNIFVRPLPHPVEQISPPGPGEDYAAQLPYFWNRPFQVILVDFGMVVSIEEHMRRPLREYVIGVGLRDAQRVTQAYLDTGVLLDKIDRAEVERSVRHMLDNHWETFLGLFLRVDLQSERSQEMLRSYQRFLETAPFQLRSEMLFVYRAMALLSGVVNQLAPDFDPEAETVAFTQRLIALEFQQHGDEWIRTWTRDLLQLPARLDRLIRRVEQGAPAAQSPPDQSGGQLQRAIGRLTWVIVAVGLLLGGVLLHAAQLMAAPATGAVVTGVLIDPGLALVLVASVVMLVGLLRR